MNRSFDVKINNKFCKQCGICSVLCPKQVIEQEVGKVPVASHLENCIGCKLCAMRCPDFAIEVEAK